MYFCFNRVRKAAMTSLMEVTLLLVQNEAELINANMYATCSVFVSYLVQVHSSPYKKALLIYCILTPLLSMTEVHQVYTVQVLRILCLLFRDANLNERNRVAVSPLKYSASVRFVPYLQPLWSLPVLFT